MTISRFSGRVQSRNGVLRCGGRELSHTSLSCSNPSHRGLTCDTGCGRTGSGSLSRVRAANVPLGTRSSSSPSSPSSASADGPAPPLSPWAPMPP
eukprot:scaffold1710_cov126-Isochrysis_galbana.AAC.1